jgi:putative ABC transport system ATP-binding protein
MTTSTVFIPPLIRMRSVSKVFHTDEIETHALHEIDLDIRPGEYVAISGPSGCGKSTLLSILGLLDSPTTGEFLLAGERVDSLTARERARVRNRQIGFIFQAFHLMGDRTVFENVELPLTYRGMDARERHRRVAETLAKVGMSHRARHYPAQLSGGQQQRVAIARALAMEPRVMLFDEVTSALDPELIGEVLDSMKALVTDFHMTMMVVTHEMGFAREVGSRLLFMDSGLVVEEGSPQEVLANPRSDRLKQFLSKVL